MENTIKVIPLTEFQKKLYTTFVETQENLISNIKRLTGETLIRKSEKNRIDNWPRLNLLQLHSIPDYINGIFLDYSDKENILLGEIEKVKSHSKTLETFSIDDNNNLQYWNLKSNPIVVRNLTTQDTLTFESYSSPRFTKDGEEDLKVKIILATCEQKMEFLEHIQSLMYNLTPIIPYPVLTPEQLDSIPDYIDGKELNTINKTQLLFEHFVPFSNNPDENISDCKTYSISNKGEIIKTFEYMDKKIHFGNPYKKDITFVKKEDCIYTNKNLSQDNSTTDLVNETRAIYEQQTKGKMENLNEYLIKDNVIPAIEEQKEQYTKYLEGKMFSDLEKDDFQEFSKEQLDSVPDKINGIDLNDLDKMKLLLNCLKKNQISYNEKLILKTINIMSTNVDFEKAKDLDVVGFERPLKLNDPVAIVHDGKNLQGKIVGFQENGDINLLISNSRDIKDLTIKADAKLEPMFILNKEEKMVYLKFTYEETIAALNNKSDINLKQSKDVKSPVFNLMLGNKTDVIPFEKNIDNKMAPVEGRLELRRKAGTGEAYVHGEVKHKELNLSLPIYGLHLNEKQKEDLVSKKDIGLVQGFKSNDGKEFALWVSLDDKLNKVVTAPERSININMIFGVKTTEEQRNQIKSGEGAVVEIKGKEYLFQASAAATKADGLKSNAIEKKVEKTESQSKEVEKEEKKNKSKGLKI